MPERPKQRAPSAPEPRVIDDSAGGHHAELNPLPAPGAPHAAEGRIVSALVSSVDDWIHLTTPRQEPGREGRRSDAALAVGPDPGEIGPNDGCDGGNILECAGMPAT